MNQYDDLPYKSLPIEWTAPERLALASMLHGGPRPRLDSYRVLELGCADGSNLLPLAYYRTNATFVGIDAARSQIETANERKSVLRVDNVAFINADFVDAGLYLSGQFDYIIAHGVFSWVSGNTREALFALCAKYLRKGGLLYLNYNTHPGWKIRGMVRDFLLASTAPDSTLLSRAKQAQQIATKVVASLRPEEQPYSKLIASEFSFVCENHVSYIAHEYLAPENHAYWRSEFLALAGQHGLAYVADADFNYRSGRVPTNLPAELVGEQIAGCAIDDTIDLLCYRQLHSPILTPSSFTRNPPDLGELSNLTIASCLMPYSVAIGEHPMFHHPSGYQVEAKETVMDIALKTLRPLWPKGVRLAALFPDVGRVWDDVKLLHQNGLIELRCAEPCDSSKDREQLNRMESCSGYVTSPHHAREAVPLHLSAELLSDAARCHRADPFNGCVEQDAQSN